MADINSSLPIRTQTDGDVVAKISDGTRTATVRDTGASDSLNVAVTDASGNQITSFGGGVEYTEDAAAAADPVGKAVILVRSDTPGTLVGTDGDNVAQRGTNYGAAYVQIVTSAGAFVDSFSGGVQYTEGDTDATITGNAMLMEVAANALQPVQGTVADGLLVNLGSNNDVTVTSGSITADTELANAVTLGDGNGNPTTAPVGAYTHIWNGSTWDRLREVVNATNSTGLGILATGILAQFDDATPTSITENSFGNVRISANRNLYNTIRDAAGNERGVNVNASNQLTVSVDNTVTVAAHAVTNAGTFAVQVDGAALTALQLIDDVVFTDDVAFTPATSKVAMVGAQFDDVATDSVDEGDAGALRMSGNRNLYMQIRDVSAERSATVTASNALKVDGSAVTQPVSIVDAQVANEVHSYDTSAGISAAASDNHDYTIGNTALLLKSISASSSGKMKIELQVGPVGTLVTKGVWFTTSANPNLDVTFPQPIEVPSASTGTVRIIRTNLESSAMDVYSFINGKEV